MPKTKTNDILTYYEIHGKGKPFVLIHGLGTSHNAWDPQTKYFSKKYKVITYDLRGHQKSQGSERKYSCELMADDLKALLDHLNIKKPIICGISLGGMIAQQYAVKYNGDLGGLILSDTATSPGYFFREALQKIILPKFGVKYLIKNLTKERSAKIFLSFFRKMNPDLKEYFKNEFFKLGKKEFSKMIDAIYDFHLLELSKIKVPTLIVVGELERKAVFSQSKNMRDIISNSFIVEIKNSVHVSNLENPEQFNKELEKFLKAHF